MRRERVGASGQGKGLAEALPAQGSDRGQGTGNMHLGEVGASEMRKRVHIPHSSLAHSLEPSRNCIPGLATADGPAPLPMCGVWLVSYPA